MKLPLIKSDEVFIIDARMYKKVEQYKWRLLKQQRANYTLKYVTSQFYVNGKHKIIYLHRLLTDCPDGYVVDHINGNGLDNRMSNLRICDKGQNLMNWHNRVKRGKSSSYVTQKLRGL